MYRLKDISIKNKLTAIVILTSTTAVLIACMTFIILDRSNIKKSLVRDLTVIADIVGANNTAALVFNSQFDALETLAALNAEPHIQAACIYTTGGQQFATFVRSGEGQIEFPSVPDKYGPEFGEDHLSILRHIILDDKVIGSIYLRQDLTIMDQRLVTYIGSVTIVILISLIIAYIVLLRLQRVISIPVKHLADTARNVSEREDYSIRATQFGNDEIGFLINKFNEMLEQIQSRDVELREAREGLEFQVQERTIELETELVERQRTEAALKESELTYRTLYNSATDGIFIMSEGDIIDCNDYSLKMFRCSREQLLNMAIPHLSPPRQADGMDSTVKAKQQLEAAMAGTPQMFEWQHKRFDGSLFEAEISLIKMDTAGKQTVMALTKDITERKREERAQTAIINITEAATRVKSLDVLLAIVCEQIGTVIDTTNFYVAEYDYDKEIYTFPFSRDEIEGDGCEPLRLKNSVTDYVRRTGRPHLIDSRVYKELYLAEQITMVGAPSKIWLGVPLKISGEVSGVMVIQDYHDKTKFKQRDLELMMFVAGPIARVIERKKAEQKNFELQQKLERAERMESLGILAGGVAHDLNNMLGPVVGYSEMILMSTDKDSKIGKRVSKIFKSAQDAADVIQDLLTLARRGRYEMTPLNLNSVIREYLESPSCARLYQGRKDVSLDFALDDSIGLINGSAPHLAKVFMNLVVNAYDAMPEGGNLLIETSQKYIEQLLGGHSKIIKGEYIVVRVKDTGMGIDEKDMDKIFEPYYSRKQLGTSGSGLGLSVVYGVVKDHRGYYDIFTKVGVGTEFVLYFPICLDAVETEDDDQHELRGTESILVVDDVAEQRDMASEILTMMGYSVTQAVHGHAALDYLKDHRVDLVILDMIMEKDFDGLDTYREIIKLHPNQKAIIVSGFSATDRVEELRKLGAGNYIKKPFTIDILGRAIREELDTLKVTS